MTSARQINYLPLNLFMLKGQFQCPFLLQDPFSRNLRRTVMRYVNLSIILVFRLVSTKVHARFPTYESLVEAKMMLPHEVNK